METSTKSYSTDLNMQYGNEADASVDVGGLVLVRLSRRCLQLDLVIMKTLQIWSTISPTMAEALPLSKLSVTSTLSLLTQITRISSFIRTSLRPSKIWIMPKQFRRSNTE